MRSLHTHAARPQAEARLISAEELARLSLASCAAISENCDVMMMALVLQLEVEWGRVRQGERGRRGAGGLGAVPQRQPLAWVAKR